MSRSTRRIAGAAIAGVCIAALAAPAFAAPGGGQGKGNPQGPLMDLQILSFNDFHGNLEPIPSTSSSGRLQVDPYVDFEDVDNDKNFTETVNMRAAGGVEYLATHLAAGPRGPPQHADRRRRRPHRRLPAALGRVPRRADHRVDERARASTSPRSATTSSTRATRSSSGWPTAAASTTATARTTRTPAPTHTVRGRRLRLPRRQREVRRDRRDDPAAVHDQERATAPRSASSA